MLSSINLNAKADPKASPSGFKWPVIKLFGFYAGISIIMGFVTGADNAAHIGGLISGAIIGLISYFTLPKQGV